MILLTSQLATVLVSAGLNEDKLKKVDTLGSNHPDHTLKTGQCEDLCVSGIPRGTRIRLVLP